MHPAFLPSTPLLPRSNPQCLIQRRPVLSANLSLQPLLDRAISDTKIVLKTTTKLAAITAVIAALALPLDATLAARGGGRMGGSSFRAPSVQRVRPSPGYSGGYSGGGGYGYGGMSPGLFMNPFIMPFGFGFGGGFGPVFLLATAAAFVYSSVQQGADDREVEQLVDPKTAIVLIKVGLLANARQLQVRLDTLARGVDTSSTKGLRFVLSETVTSLLRQPDYWSYASINVRSENLSRAEALFDSMCMEERLKLEEETLVNVSGRLVDTEKAAAKEPDLNKNPGQYILVSLAVAAEGDVIAKLPKNIDTVKDVEKALRALGGVGAGVQGVQVVWAPQSLKDILSERELLEDHPELKRL